MVDLRSTEGQRISLEVYRQLLHVYIGVYLWEILVSLDFEWALLSRKKQFRWPLILYFLNRYCTLASLLTTMVVFDVKPANCQGIFRAMLFQVHLAISLASLVLALRAIAVWNKDKLVIAGVALFTAAHLSLDIYQVAVIKINIVPGIGCATATMVDAPGAAIYATALAYDGAILALTVYKLRVGLRAQRAAATQFSLITIVFRQGIIYFLLSLFVNLIVVIMLILHYNNAMIGASTSLAAVACSIAAGRAVRSLYHTSPFPERSKDNHSLPSVSNSSHSGGRNPGNRPSHYLPARNFVDLKASPDRVHVQKETIIELAPV